MQNKSKLNTILLVIIIILLVVGLIYLFFFNTKQRENIISDVNQITNKQNLNADLYPLYPNLTWGDALSFSQNSFDGFKITANNILDNQFYSASPSFANYYESKLTSLGWVRDNNLQADGAGSSSWAYTKNNEIIILSYDSTAINQKPNEPLSCPCNMTVSIFSGVKNDSISTKNIDNTTDQLNKITWIKSPKFGLYYQNSLNIIEYYADKYGKQVSDGNGWGTFSATWGKDQDAGLTWGGNYSETNPTVGGGGASCMNESDFGTFKYGVSSVTCLRGVVARVYHSSARNPVTKEDLKIFGDFILKNR